MQTSLLATLSGLLALCASCTSQQPVIPAADFAVFVTQDTIAVPYRIPAIGTAHDGTLVAVADYRYSREDIGNGRLDLALRLSHDNGNTWGEIILPEVMRGNGDLTNGNQKAAYGDPCIVGDRESGRMMITSCSGFPNFFRGSREQHQGWARWYSDDNGTTWGEPVYLDEDFVYAPLDASEYGTIKGWFVGSGKITQSRQVKIGQYYRLYCAGSSWNGVETANWAMYSDDFGETWAFLGGCDKSPVSGGDEPKVEELPDGNILISSRCVGGRRFNIFTFAAGSKSEGTWAEPVLSGEANNGVTARENGCNGELMLIPAVRVEDGQKVDLLLQSVPFGPRRNNVGIYYKALVSAEDYATPEAIAADWEGGFQVTTLGSAYSTMTWQNNNTLGFLYEEETYCDTSGGGYTIMYKNYTLEDITEGKYRF